MVCTGGVGVVVGDDSGRREGGWGRTQECGEGGDSGGGGGGVYAHI